MNEVEKMYENAKVEQKRMCEWTCKDSEVCNTLCEHYESTQLYYPPFTAEKQLKLIEFMLKKYGEETIGFELWKDNSYHAMCHLGYDGFENYADSNTLCDAIAGLITLYWQSLTEEERKQIKEILSE